MFIKIKEKKIGFNYPPYIIAEACINHEGKINLAKEMVYQAKKNGADCVKFQYHILDDEMLRKAPKSSNFKEDLYTTLKKTNLTLKEHIYLKKFCKKNKIHYLCTPFSKKSVDVLKKDIKVDFFKTGSGELTNLPFQLHVAKQKKPVIISTGMSNMEEIARTVNLVKKINKNIILTQCTSVYPCPSNLTGIELIPIFKKRFNVITGLSDHSNNIYSSLGAVALGASLIEKHFTLDKSAKGPDHASSIEPKELKELVIGANEIYNSKKIKVKKILKEEKQIISWARESVVLVEDVKKGEKFNENNISTKRPGAKNGEIESKYFYKVLGKRCKKDIKKNKTLKWIDLI